jgi:hypothetical protein
VTGDTINSTLFYGYKIKEDESGAPCSMHLRNEKYVQNTSLKGRNYLENLVVDRRIILKYIVTNMVIC